MARTSKLPDPIPQESPAPVADDTPAPAASSDAVEAASSEPDPAPAAPAVSSDDPNAVRTYKVTFGTLNVGGGTYAEVGTLVKMTAPEAAYHVASGCLQEV